MNEMQVRMLRHLAGVLAEAAAGIIAIIDEAQDEQPDPEAPARPRWLGDTDTPAA